MLADEDVRALLNQAPVPPTRLGVDGLLHAGRRKVRQRRLTAAGGVAALVVAVVAVLVGPAGLARHDGNAPLPPAVTPSPDNASPPATKPGECRYSELAVPPGGHLTLSAVSPNGRYVGGSGYLPVGQRPVLWTDGIPQVLGDEFGSVMEVNSAGVVLVDDELSNFAQSLRVYNSSGSYQLTGPAGTTWTQFIDPVMNERGDIVAVGADNHGGTRTLLWPAGAHTGQVLPLPKDAEVKGIADDGTLIGTLSDRWAYRWDAKGHGTRLSEPAGWYRARAYAVQGDWVLGELVRYATPPTAPLPADKPDVVPVLWNLRTGQFVELPQITMGVAVTASGLVLGFRDDQQLPGTDAPVLVQGSTVRQLPLAGKELDGIGMSGSGLVIANTRIPGTKGDPQLSTWQC